VFCPSHCSAEDAHPSSDPARGCLPAAAKVRAAAAYAERKDRGKEGNRGCLVVPLLDPPKRKAQPT